MIDINLIWVPQMPKQMYKDHSNQWSTYYTGIGQLGVGDMFSVQLLPKKLTKIIQILEALKQHIENSFCYAFGRGFFGPSGKKRAYYAFLENCWQFLVSNSNLGNF